MIDQLRSQILTLVQRDTNRGLHFTAGFQPEPEK